jgi:signal transduction histidine kinase
MTNRWTIRARLTVLYGGLFLVGGALLLSLTYLLVQQSLERSRPADQLAVRFADRLPGGAAGMRVRFADGREIPIDQVPAEYRRREEAFRQETLNSLLKQGGIALGGIAVIAVGFGWLMAERALRPVHRITETARRVTSGNLHERIALQGPRDEIKELADTVDSMLDRLDQSFDGQRRFVMNASHELRTPLTINRTLMEVALGRPNLPPEARQLAETLLAVNERHERLIDGLLTLARSDQELTVREPVDLAEVARHVRDAAGSEIIAELAPAPTTGDPVLLERLAQNLVENALAYNVPDGWVSVRTYVHGGQATLVVENTGPVVPAYEIPGLFEPFRRLRDRTNSAHGTGLGLSIVRAVAVSHHGSVVAAPREGGGFVVTVTLPAAEG